MSNLLPDIDFSKIRTIQNSQNKGFEELAVQLFRSTFPEKTEFYRVDDKGGDGGVEDVAIISKNEKIGMQAKYFTKLTQSQWTQINKSVKTAIQSYAPYLIEYRIYTPINRSKDKTTWDNYKEKWNTYAKSKYGYTQNINFYWNGETELSNELIKQKHREKLQYWFNSSSFGMEWLKKEFKKSRASIDTRYTPDLHIKTSVESQLNAFCLTQRFKDRLIGYLKKLKSNIYELLDRLNELPKIQRENIVSHINKLENVFLDVIYLPSYEFLHKLFIDIETSLKITKEYYRNLQKNHPDFNPNSYSENPYNYEFIYLYKSIADCVSASNFIFSFQVYDKQFLLLEGEAGTGKSHIMTNLIENSLKKDQFSILFIGEHFISNEPPQQQIKSILDWNNSFHVLLQLFEQDARIKMRPSLILIDALNECTNKNIWLNYFMSFIEEIKNFPNVRLLVSCRSDFLNYVLPDSISRYENQDFGYIEHHGFDLNLTKAIETYFKGYKIKSDHFPPLIEEFKNPLFLKIFCEAYAGQQIPHGPRSLNSIMEARIKQCQKELLLRLDCPEYIFKDAIEFISDEILNNNGIGIPQDKVQRKMDELFYSSSVSSSLYKNLISNGFIIETFIRGELSVRFPYERFSDYLLTKRILTKLNIKNLKTLKNKLKLIWQYLSNPFEYRNFIKMFTLLIPENFQIELIQLIKEPIYHRILKKIPFIKGFLKEKGEIYSIYYFDFWDSLVWRSRYSILPITKVIFEDCLFRFHSNTILNGLFKMATIPDHPFNALLLHTKLKEKKLYQLELSWTIPVSNLVTSRSNTIELFIDWTFNVSYEQVDNKQAWLAALTLAWLLSNNNKGFRRRVSLALIKLLIGRIELVIKLMEEFNDCVDAYITERVYAAVCGIVLREPNINRLKLLISAIYKYIFSEKTVPANILIRDYAFTIMQYGIFRKAIASSVDLKRIYPPYNSDWSGFPYENYLEYRCLSDGWNIIRASLQPEKSGWYGDFGRYVMESAAHQFSNQRLNESYTAGKRYENIIDGIDIGNFIFKRVKDLGWCPELFGEYEETLRHGRLSVDEEMHKVERISKKYQWIGLYELLGHLADNYWLHSDYDTDQPRICCNAKSFNLREFDPSQPLIDPQVSIIINEDDENHISSDEKINLLDENFSDEIQLIDREAWVSTPPKDFSSLIERKEDNEDEWLLLAGHFYKNETLKLYQDERIFGRNKLWVDIRCWLLNEEDLDEFTNYIEDVKFYGRGLHHIELNNSWLGEYPWASDCQWIRDACNKSPDWLRNCSLKIITTECEYSGGQSQRGFLPSPQLIDIMRLHWSGDHFDYHNEEGNKICICKYYSNESEPYLYIKKKIFIDSIKNVGYIPIWATLSEKSCYSNKANKPIVNKWSILQRIYGERNNNLYQITEKKYDIPLLTNNA